MKKIKEELEMILAGIGTSVTVAFAMIIILSAMLYVRLEMEKLENED